MGKINKKVIVAMSGGVDSSVTALLMKEKYIDVVGVFLHFWKDDDVGDEENKCCSTKSLMDARNVCQKLDIPLYTMNFYDEFKKEIVDYFLNSYESGETPNPCVMCNRFVKLGLLIERACEMDFDLVATGHYAQIIKNDAEVKLLKGIDSKKDQSYFLYKLTEEQLNHLEFPVGGMIKEDVRKMAKENNLNTASKQDSQEVCFVGSGGVNGFLKKYLKLKPGKIIDTNGKGLGEHKDLSLYTLGQRKGIEIGGTGPYYAVEKNYKDNVLVVSNNKNDERLLSDNFKIVDCNWQGELEFPIKAGVVLRYGMKPVKCVVEKYKNNEFVVKTDEKIRAITPGQSAVFYNGEEVLGGGAII